MIYVDELRVWPTKIRCFKSGSCHMFTDGDIEDLHRFAAGLGLRREWFQQHPLVPHYDLTPARRAKAVAIGASEVNLREHLAKLKASR